MESKSKELEPLIISRIEQGILITGNNNKVIISIEEWYKLNEGLKPGEMGKMVRKEYESRIKHRVS